MEGFFFRKKKYFSGTRGGLWDKGQNFNIYIYKVLKKIFIFKGRGNERYLLRKLLEVNVRQLTQKYPKSTSTNK